MIWFVFGLIVSALTVATFSDFRRKRKEITKHEGANAADRKEANKAYFQSLPITYFPNRSKQKNQQ